MREIGKTRRPPDDIRRDRLIKITKRAEKAARRQVLDELCSKIVNENNRSDDGANGAAPLDTAPPINDTDAETYGCSEEEDAIAAMMMLNGTSNMSDALQTQDM